MLITIILVLIIIITILIIFIGGRPYVHKNILLDNVSKYIETLLKRGYNKGFMVIYVENKNKNFVQFKKYINKENIVNIELGFPLAEWSKMYYLNLKKLLEKDNIKFEIIKKDNNNPLEFIVINCKTDIQLCAYLVQSIFVKIFNYNESNIKLKIYFINGSTINETIGIIPKNK